MLKIAVAGASGRMGRMLVEAVLGSDDCALAGALDIAGSPALGQDAGAFLGRTPACRSAPTCAPALAGADVLIDFTRPEGTLAHLAACRELGVKAVIGTTGFTPAQKAEIAAHAQQIAIVLAPNMSVGVNVMLRLLRPGRALRWATATTSRSSRPTTGTRSTRPAAPRWRWARCWPRRAASTWPAHGVFARHGHTGERPPGAIGFATVRGGDIVGDHTVLFAGTGERIEITHRSTSRANYAAGSLRAARFLAGQPRGLFGMDQVLGLAA